jgi:hypothetical protein
MIGVTSLVLLTSGLARAEAAGSGDAPAAAPSAAKLNAEGFALYKARDYRRAVEKFLQAYALEPDPNLLFNVARCYEALGDNAAAMEKYRMFIAQPEADADGKRRAQEALRVLSEKRSEPAAAPAPAAPAPAPPPAPAAAPVAAAPVVAAPAPPPAPAAAVAVSAAPQPGAGKAIKTWRVVALGAGITATAVGVTLLVIGKQNYDQVSGSAGFGNPNAVDPMTEGAARKLLDSGHSMQVAGALVLGVGVASLLTSVALFARTPSSEGEPRNVAFGISPERGGADVVMGARF